MQNCAAPPFGGIFCIFWYKTYKDCEINNYQLNHLTKHGKIWLSIGGQSGKKKGDFKTMGYKSDIEIAQECTMQPITAIAEKAGIDDKYLEQYGKYKAKIDYNLLKDTNAEDGKLILVTAINPTPAGEGKTTTSVGLVDGLSRIGKKAMVALREPSLGPVFGVKGGAAGGGYAQVVPMEDINLHFTGDFHAIGAANNLLAAMIDNHIFQGNELNIDPRKITWKRCVDINDLHRKVCGTDPQLLCFFFVPDSCDLRMKLADLALQLCNIITCCQCFYAEPFRIGTHHIQRLRSDRSG